MVGREAELTALLEAFAAAEAGEAQVALVLGEAGIGKTRLVREFLERLPQGTTVAVGHAVPLSAGAIPYGVVSDLLRSVVHEVGHDAVADSLGSRTSFLAPLVPRLAAGVGEAVDRLALFAATQDLLADLAEDGPVVLVVEDAHWADESSFDLLTFWSRTMQRSRILLVLTARDVGTDEAVLEHLNGLRHVLGASASVLRHLSANEVARQAASLDDTIGEVRLAEVARLSEGVPLYVEELVAEAQGNVSDLLRVDLLARVRDLGAEDARLLYLASLESRPVDPSQLAVVGDVSISRAEAALTDAVAAGLLVGADDGRYGFRHELLRVAAVEKAPQSLRREGHQRWARVLVDDFGTPGDRTAAADHLAGLGPSRAGFLARMAAADEIWGVSSSHEAAVQWQLALMLIHLDSTLATEEEHDLTLAAVCMLADTPPEQLHSLMAVEESFTGPEPSVRRDFLDLRAAVAEWAVGGWDDPDLVIQQVAHHRLRLERHPPTPLLFEACTLLLRACWFVDRFDAEFERCVDLVERAVPDLPDRCTNATAVLIVWRALTVTTPEERAAFYREAVELTGGLDHLSRCRVLAQASLERIHAGDFRAAQMWAREAQQLLRGPDAHFLWNSVTAYVALASSALGEWDRAEEEARQARVGHPSTVMRLEAFFMLAQLLLDRGRHEEVASLLADIERSALRATATFHPQGFIDTIRAALLAEQDPAAAGQLLAQHVCSDVGVYNHTEGGWFGRAWSLAAELAWRDPSSSATCTEALREAAARSLARDPLGAVWRVEVEAHLARAAGSETGSGWRAAVAGWDELGVVFQAARCRLRLSEALLAEGDRGAAATALADGLTTAESLGARPLADEIRALAARARLPLPGSEPAAGAQTGALTARELDVLQLLVDGRTNDQIGAALFMSPKTASVHVSHILQKLGAANRTEVATLAHRRGLIAL